MLTSRGRSTRAARRTFGGGEGTLSARRFRPVLLAAMSLAGALVLVPVSAAQTPLTLVQPNGGELIPAGSLYTIRWTTGDAAATRFDLFASFDGGRRWKKINTDGRLSGDAYDWTVPAKKHNKTLCRVKVVGYSDAGNKVGRDLSDGTFSIKALDVTSPNGEETLASGTIVRVTWETLTEIPAPQAALFYTLNAGETWRAIGVGDNTGSLDWTVPQGASTLRAKVRVELRSASGARVAVDVSDRYFTIERRTAVNQDLQGAYLAGEMLVASPRTTNSAVTAILDVNADGSGNATYVPVLDSSGFLEAGTATYQVAIDGQVTVVQGVQTHHGILSRSGDVLLLADTTDEGAVGTILAIRKGSDMTPAVLEGTWIAGVMRQDVAPMTDSMSLVEIALDAVGSGTVHCLYSNEATGCPADAQIALALAPDGSFTTGASATRGAVSPDGSVLMIVGADAAGGSVSFTVGMKLGSLPPAASLFSGRFAMSNLDLEPTRSISSEFAVKSDGMKQVKFFEQYASSGPLTRAAGTYEFNPGTGLISVNQTTRGVVLEDGQGFLAIETDSPSGTANMSIGLKAIR